MADQLEIIAQHGWGFSSAPWKKWLRDFANCTGFVVSSKTFDRGYFSHSPESKPSFDSVQTELISDQQARPRRIVVAHSLGLHLIPAEVLSASELLVAFSTFTHFHDQDSRKSRVVVSKMLSKLEHSPASVVRDFLANCYEPKPRGMVINTSMDAAELNSESLRSDLETLNQNSLDISSIAKLPQVLLLHGTDDCIVHFEHAQRLNQSLPNSKLILIEGAGHALPFTHPSACHLSIRQAVLDAERAKIRRMNAAAVVHPV